MSMKAINVDCFGGDPLDLSDCTEISVALPNADGTTTTLKLSDEEITIKIPAVLGGFLVPISSEVSQFLNVGQYQDLVVTFTISGQLFGVRFTGALSVFQV